MLASYLDQAMEQAVYEIIEDEDAYWGEIPGLRAYGRGIERWKDVAASYARR